jgi:hypothetical protein
MAFFRLKSLFFDWLKHVLSLRGDPRSELFYQKYLNIIRFYRSNNAQADLKLVSSPLWPRAFLNCFIEMQFPAPGGLA